VARTFDFATGPNYAITGVGSCGAVGNGAYTIAALFNIVGNAGIISFRATGINAQLIVDTNQLFGAGDFQGGQTGVTTGTWWWAAIRKASGSAVYQYSLRAYNSGSTTHQSGSVNHADSGVANTSIRLGDGDDRGNGSIAVWAAWTSALSDAQVASMFTIAAADVATLSPQALWLGNQASSANAIPDSTGNGAGSTSFNGTVGVGSDPPSYNYSLTAAQASAVQPIVVTGPRSPTAGQQVLLRNTAALVVAAAKGVAPLVVARPAPTPQGAAVLRRATLVDPPVLTTPQPIVVARTGGAPPGSAVLLRSSLADAAQPSAATPAPYVVTAPQSAPFSAPILARNPAAPLPAVQPDVITAPAVAAVSPPIILRGSLADAPVLTTPAPLVVTTPTPGPANTATFIRNPQAPAAAPATRTLPPIVITAAAVSAAGQTLTVRGSLADAPVLTTASPTVVTARASAPAAAALILRTRQAASQPAAATPGPFVITRPAPAGRSVVVVIAGSPVSAAPAGTSAPTDELVTRSGGLNLAHGRPSPNLVASTASRNLVSQTTSRNVEA
jgi:hypothetical protein